MRLLDLYYKGGETIRGFNTCGYRSARSLLTGDAVGGSTFWATTAELRFPLPFIPDELGMSGARIRGCRLAVRCRRRGEGLEPMQCSSRSAIRANGALRFAGL